MKYTLNTILHGFLLILSTLITTMGFAQIQGSVKESNNQSVPFANVILISQIDSSMVLGLMASEEGTFSITNFNTGHYIIKASMVGYKSAFSTPFEIKTSNDHIHLEPILIESSDQQLGDVTVVAKKPIYEMKIDRMVVNVENAISSSGNTALEVLEKSPGVIVDRQNSSISLSGKSGVVVMINGKANRMPIAAAVQMLDAMNADNVKHIELITTPPAKYDAEGDAGIINIILKKNDNFGTNGSYTLGAGYSHFGKGNASINLNHHIKKINFFGMYGGSYNQMLQSIEVNRLVNQSGSLLETNSNSERNAKLLFQNARLGFDYTISSKTVVGVLVEGYLRNWNMEANNDIVYKRDQVVSSTSKLNTIEPNLWQHGMASFNLQHHFTEEEVLDFNLDLLKYNNEVPSSYKIENIDNAGNIVVGDAIEASKKTPINIFVGTLDYSKPFGKKLKMDVGIKGNFSNLINDVAVNYLQSGNWVKDEVLTNSFSLEENITAAYSTFNYQMNEKTSLVAGLRYEYINSVLSSESEQGLVDLHYGHFFPSLFLSRKLNADNTIQFSYSKRIDRPTYSELAPFILFLTPETFVTGNVNLLPAISHIVKGEFQHKRIIFSASYSNTENVISRFQPQINEAENKLYLISRNLDNQKTVSMMLSFPLKIAKWWTVQNNVSGVYQKLTSKYEGEDLLLSNQNFQLNSVNNFSFSKRISGEISGYYQSGSLSGIYKLQPFGRLDIGLQFKFKDDKSRLNLNLSDVFKTAVYRSTASIPELNINTRTKLDFEPRVLRLTFSHNFGNSELKSARKRNAASEEEQNRIGN